MSTTKLAMQSFIGPSDPGLPRSEIEGYMPVSRIGEVVINAFVDSQEYIRLANPDSEANQTKEPVPHYHEWAAVLPGMVCLMRKRRHESFLSRVAAETAVPVISSVQCLGDQSNDGGDGVDDWLFAGIARSKSVPPIDDGNGPSIDEYFTLALGGMACVLNSSNNSHVFPGDYVEWCFNVDDRFVNGAPLKRYPKGPRRVGVKATSTPTLRTFGVAKSHAGPREIFDVLIYQA
jgi:hypothetical protein